MIVFRDCVAGVVRRLVRIGLGIYFRRVERFNAERVPATGPVLFASNHPGSITDAFLIGTALKRRVGFVGTVQLFRWGPLAWLLRICGIIPVLGKLRRIGRRRFNDSAKSLNNGFKA